MKNLLFLVILFCNYPILQAQQLNNAFALEGVKWTSNTIPVSWENPSSADEQERHWVEEAIRNTWQQNSGITFTGWTKSTPSSKGIRIRIEDASTGPHTIGLGKQLDGKANGMTLNFTFQQWSTKMLAKRKEYIVAIAVHEFGHALGLAHEHNRSDCTFCDKEKQGADGDYYITTCDLNSVMNYCNPNYNNWGQLSEGDKKAIGILYPKSNTKVTATMADNHIDVAHTSRDLSQTEKKVWTDIKKFIKVYIQATPEEMQLIKQVTYHLHPSFPTPVMTISDATYNYGLGLFVWGQFELSAVIKYKDGSEKIITHFLDFDLPPGENAPGTKPTFVPDLNNTSGSTNESESGQVALDFNSIRKKDKSSGSDSSLNHLIHQEIISDKQQRLVSLSLNSNMPRFNQINKVEYFIPREGHQEKQSTLNKSDHFSTSFIFQDKQRIEIKIYFEDQTMQALEYEVKE